MAARRCASPVTLGTAAFLVLEAAKPWSRNTHKYFPEVARARAVELWPWGFRFSRQFPREEQAMYDVWMTIVMAHEVTRDYRPPPPPPPRRSARVAGRAPSRHGPSRLAADH